MWHRICPRRMEGHCMTGALPELFPRAFGGDIQHIHCEQMYRGQYIGDQFCARKPSLA